MGALHAGHLSLLEAARQECHYVAVSIFVNPAQFGPQEDFAEYPRTWDADIQACSEYGVQLVYHPSREVVYPLGFQTYLELERLSTILEGQFRPGHFRGVATVVLKLFNIVQPDVAYFGEKDYQQQLLVRTMCRELNLPLEIRVCPTVREPDGLALSSRNANLDPAARQSALRLSQSLQIARERLLAGETGIASVKSAMRTHLESAAEIRVDYATIADPQTLEDLSRPESEMVALVAAHVGSTRLIDNLPIRLT